MGVIGEIMPPVLRGLRMLVASLKQQREIEYRVGVVGHSSQEDDARALHSITSSARESRSSEILTPSALAVLRLITSSNLVDCNTGSSAGLAPLRIFAV